MADEAKGGVSPAITVAIISGVVAIVTTLLTQWDKIFPHRASAPVPSATSPAPADTPAPRHDPPASAPTAARETPPPLATSRAAPNPPVGATGETGPVSIAGIWYTDEGDEFTFAQTGATFTYKHAHNGSPASIGSGELTGTRVRYAYTSKTGAGTCEAAFAELGEALVGRCHEGGQSWPVRIHR